MQSRLPDVNTAFITHRKGAKEAIKSRNWDNAFGSLYSWNALLPRHTEKIEGNDKLKYRVAISDIEYESITAIRSVAICLNSDCAEQIPYNEVHVLDLIVPIIEGIISGETISQYWICPKCDAENKMIDTTIAESSFQEPVFYGVVPKPPTRKEGLQDRGNYDRKCTQWCWNMINELEEKSTQFREDYRENKNEFEAWDEEYDAETENKESEADV